MLADHPFEFRRRPEVFAEADEGPADEEAPLSKLLESPQQQCASPTVSTAVSSALTTKDWTRALELAIQEGWRNENKLTNLLFFARHPELKERRLHPATSKQDQELSKEWAQILNHEVWPVIVTSTANAALAVSGGDVTERPHANSGAKMGTSSNDASDGRQKRLASILACWRRTCSRRPEPGGTISRSRR